MEKIIEAQSTGSNIDASSKAGGSSLITGGFERDKADSFALSRLPAEKVYPVVFHEPEIQTDRELRLNDNKILSLLNEDTGSCYSFKGLMRKLKLHQQSLSRALYRLEQSGLISRSQNGYRLKLNAQGPNPVKGRDLLGGSSKGSFIILLQTFIPKGFTARNILESLVGKWFGSLRWIGLIEMEIGCSLQWANEENSFQVNLKIIWDSIIIETNASSNSDEANAMVGSVKMFEQITKLLQTALQNKDPKKLLHRHLLS